MEIKGNWETREVTIDGKPLDPSRSQKIWNHSPDGFNWGYGGSGPAQLALALLLQTGLSDHDVIHMYQLFKQDVISKLPQSDFTMNYTDITSWIEQHERGCDFCQSVQNGKE